MTPELKWQAADALPGDEHITHAWLGMVGPRPSILTAISLAFIAMIFAHFVVPLPTWWPFAAGGVAIIVNLAIAIWQAGSVRVVAVTSSGIHVLRKGRWSISITHILGSMPRMPLGPLIGRWCLLSVANTEMWVHRKYHPLVDAFDDQYRGRFEGTPSTGVLLD